MNMRAIRLRRKGQRAEVKEPSGAESNARAKDDAVLAIRHLAVTYDRGDAPVHAARDVSFELHRRERLGIVGESGAGKSALATAIVGLLQPPGRVEAGEVWLHGRDISKLSDRELRRIRGREIALILQDPMSSLNPVKTIGAQMIEAVRVHDPGLGRAGSRRRAAELLSEVDISHAERRLDDYPHAYSGGMRQRVAIAMAIAHNPQVLIADEPTTALDVTTQAQVLALLDRIVDDHSTAVILITHNLGIVSEFCDSVAVMYAGRFVETCAVDHIFTSPTHPYSEALLRCVPNPETDIDGLLPAISGSPPDLTCIPAGCSFAPRCPVATVLCRAERPYPHTVEGCAGEATVECHFAEQRIREVRA